MEDVFAWVGGGRACNVKTGWWLAAEQPEHQRHGGSRRDTRGLKKTVGLEQPTSGITN